MEEFNKENIVGEVYRLEAEESTLENIPEAPSPEPEEEVSLADSVKTLSPTQLVLKRFFRSKLSIIGLAIIIFLFVFCWIGPLFSPYDETAVDDETDRLNITVSQIEVVVELDDGTTTTYTVYKVDRSRMEIDILASPSAEHWLGTDANGRDVLTRIMYGGRTSLTLSLMVVLLETIIGVVLGGLAGYFGKWVDTIIMRIIDVFSCIPSLPIMLIIGSVLNGAKVDVDYQIYIMMAVLTLLGWTGVARIVRGQILTLREQEFMVSATARGLSTSRKIFRHLIPNVIPQLIVSMTLGLGSIILTEASLSYMGLGVPLTSASWGGMINDVTGDVSNLAKAVYTQIWVPAGLCIVLAVLGFNFIGDGLRDAFDPKAKR